MPQAVVEAVAGGRATLTKDDVPRLRFTEAVVREALRLYPPVAFLPRQAVKADAIRGRRVDLFQLLAQHGIGRRRGQNLESLVDLARQRLAGRHFGHHRQVIARVGLGQRQPRPPLAAHQPPQAPGQSADHRQPRRHKRVPARGLKPARAPRVDVRRRFHLRGPPRLDHRRIGTIALDERDQITRHRRARAQPPPIHAKPGPTPAQLHVDPTAPQRPCTDTRILRPRDM